MLFVENPFIIADIFKEELMVEDFLVVTSGEFISTAYYGVFPLLEDSF